MTNNTQPMIFNNFITFTNIYYLINFLHLLTTLHSFSFLLSLIVIPLLPYLVSIQTAFCFLSNEIHTFDIYFYSKLKSLIVLL